MVQLILLLIMLSSSQIDVDVDVDVLCIRDGAPLTEMRTTYMFSMEGAQGDAGKPLLGYEGTGSELIHSGR
jgi:hypothetical protein